MAYAVKAAARKFIIEKDGKGNKNVTLKDPHTSMSIQEVINHYSTEYPQLTTANVEGPTMEGDVAVYKFTAVLGTKG